MKLKKSTIYGILFWLFTLWNISNSRLGIYEEVSLPFWPILFYGLIILFAVLYIREKKKNKRE